jgi:hypothetical protein
LIQFGTLKSFAIAEKQEKKKEKGYFNTLDATIRDPMKVATKAIIVNIVAP